MKKQTDQLLKVIVSLAVAAMFCIIAASGLLATPDGVLSDAFYQEEQAGNADIVLVEIDERALEAFGPMPWSRNVLAETIRTLNSAADGSRPAAIGLDILYVGSSGDQEADEALAEAAREGGNVVAAGYAVFGTEMIEEGDQFFLKDRQVLEWESPYPELAEAAEVAHINTMEDEDAILRHAMTSIEVPGEGEVKSLSRALYERWCSVTGQTPNPAPADIGGFFYLPYTKEPGGYSDGISVADVLSGAVPPETFADRIVLIGPYAAAMQDDYRTTIARAEPMYGVEIHANMIDAYERNFFPREAPKALQLLVLFAVSAGLLLFFLDRKIPAATAAWGGSCALWFGAAKLLYLFGGAVLHVLWIPLASTVLYVVSVAVNYIRAQRARRRVTNTFGHYVDRSIMKQLLEQGSEALQLGGKLCDIAVLFVDIRGFTTMSENLDPPTVVEIINKYLTLTTDCIMRNHGTLDKFVGDCTMAFWNAPVEQEDPVYLACCAAMDMVEGSKALGEELQQRFGRTVSFGVGVNFGPAVVGNIGAPSRMDYTAIGDTVNTASRLEANAPGGTIFISRVVADMLGDRAKTTSLGGTIKLKGKAEGFEILTLDELKRA